MQLTRIILLLFITTIPFVSHSQTRGGKDIFKEFLKGNGAQQSQIFDAQKSILDETRNHILDSLKKSEIDTILIFEQNCSGCILSLDNTIIYICWRKNKKDHIYQVGLYPQKNKKIQGNFFTSIEYAAREFQSLSNEKIADSDIIMSHGWSYSIEVFLNNGDHIRKDIDAANVLSVQNCDTYTANLIYRLFYDIRIIE